MPLPQRIPNPTKEIVTRETVCSLAAKWRIEPVLAQKIINGAGDLPFEIWLFSGARSISQQKEVSDLDFN